MHENQKGFTLSRETVEALNAADQLVARIYALEHERNALKDAIFELRAINEQRDAQVVNQANLIRNMRASIDRLSNGDKPDIINLCGADVAAGLKFMDAAYAPQSRHAAHDEVLSESVKQEGCALDPLEDAIGAVTQALVDTLGVPAELVRIQIINGNQARGLDGTYDDGARGYGYGPVAGSLGPFNRRG
jgi:hypothetical protein